MDYAVVWQHAATQPHSPQQRTFTDLINVTLARLICKLPDDGRVPKHVGADLMYILMFSETDIKCTCW